MSENTNKLGYSQQQIDALEWNSSSITPPNDVTIIVKRADGTYRVGYYGPELSIELEDLSAVWSLQKIN